MSAAETLGSKPTTQTEASSTLDPDLLAAVIDETARRVEARAARPSPVHLRSWQEIERFAEKAAKSGMVPKDYIGKPDAICIAVQLGSELGLAPMQAVQNVAVINGRPSIWGDAMIGLCRASGAASYIREWFEGEDDALTFYCESKRRDDPTPIRRGFSVTDAKRAGLWKETPKITKQGRDGPYEVDSGPWYSYPQRMLQMRARGFCLRDAFPDVLKGLMAAEEARDIPWDDTEMPTSAIIPPRSHADVSGRAPKTQETNGTPPAQRTDAQWRAWLDKLKLGVGAVHRRSEVEEIGGRSTVGDAVATGPEWVRKEIAAILAAGVARFTPLDVTADPETGELPAVEIEGEKYMAAG